MFYGLNLNKFYVKRFLVIPLVQWLRLCAPNSVGPFQSLFRELDPTYPYN